MSDAFRGPADAQAAAGALRRLTMTEIRALAAVKAAGTLSGGARLLGVSQPTLSAQVRGIEEKLGAALFSRHRRGVDTTPAGQVMLRLAAALQADMAWAAEELAAAARDTQRPIRVGSMALTSGGLVAVALGRLATATGAPPTVLVEGPRDALLEHLRHGRVDLFVGRLPPPEQSEDLYREVLFQDSVVVIASARHPLARRSSGVTMRQLASQPWILPGEDTAFREQLEESFRRAGLQLPRARVSTYSMLAIPAIVSASSLVGFLPASLYGAGTVSGGLRHLDVPLHWSASAVGILMQPKDSDAEHLRGLLGILRGVAASARMAIAVG